MMADVKAASKPRVAEVVEQYGKCLELVPIDPNFGDISVGLYVKDGVFTIWTFSNKPDVKARIEKIRDQFVALGGMKPLKGTHNQAVPSCGQLHIRPVKFLLNQAVGKSPDFAPPQGEMSIKDSKSTLLLKIDGEEQDGNWLYHVSGEGEAPNPGYGCAWWSRDLSATAKWTRSATRRSCSRAAHATTS